MFKFDRDKLSRIVLAVIMLGAIGNVIASFGDLTVDPNYLTGFTWANGTNINVAHIWINGTDYAASIVAGSSINGTAIAPNSVTLSGVTVSNWNQVNITGTNNGVLSPFVVVGQNASKINVTNYFYCDGTADEVQAQAAADYLSSVGGGTLWIEYALYDSSDAPFILLEDTSNIRITGNLPHIRAANGIFENTFGNWSLIWIDNCSNIEIDHLKIDSNGGAQTFASYADPDQYGSGITVMSGGKFWSSAYLNGQWSYDVNIHDNVFIDSHVIAVAVHKAIRPNVHNNEVINVDAGNGTTRKAFVNTWTRYAKTNFNWMDVRDPDAPTVFVASSNGIFGICGHNSAQTGNEYWEIIGNHIIGSKDSSIELNGVATGSANYHSNFIISDNFIEGRNILLSFDCFNGVVDSNIIQYWANGATQGAVNLGIDGGTGTYTGDIVISNNLVYANETLTDNIRELVMVTTDTATVKNVLITDNYFYNAGAYGGSFLGYAVILDGGNASMLYLDEITIQGNKIFNCTSHGIRAINTNENARFTIKDNEFLNIGYTGINTYGVYVANGGYWDISGNLFLDDRATKLFDYALYVDGDASGRFVNNAVNVTTGVYLDSTAGAWVIQDNDFTGSTTALTDLGAESTILNQISLQMSAISGAGGAKLGGRNLDANTEWITYTGALPLDCFEVEYLTIMGRDVGAAETHAQGLNVTTFGASSNEYYTTHSDAEKVYNSTTTNYIQYDILLWELPNLTGLQSMKAGDYVVIILEYAPVKGDNAATNCDFGEITIHYLKGRP